MDIGYVWDHAKYERVRHDHAVEFAEVVAAFEDPHGLEEPDPQGHAERYMLLAATGTGRVLQIIYGDAYTEEGSPIYRIITAFDAAEAWRHEYERRRD